MSGHRLILEAPERNHHEPQVHAIQTCGSQYEPRAGAGRPAHPCWVVNRAGSWYVNTTSLLLLPSLVTALYRQATGWRQPFRRLAPHGLQPRHRRRGPASYAGIRRIRRQSSARLGLAAAWRRFCLDACQPGRAAAATTSQPSECASLRPSGSRWTASARLSPGCCTACSPRRFGNTRCLAATRYVRGRTKWQPRSLTAKHSRSVAVHARRPVQGPGCLVRLGQLRPASSEQQRPESQAHQCDRKRKPVRD